MLVLSRKVNEKVVIDGGIVVTVVKIEGGQVRLGIEAPGHIKVFRQEDSGKGGADAKPRSAGCGRRLESRVTAMPAG